MFEREVGRPYANIFKQPGERRKESPWWVEGRKEKIKKNSKKTQWNWESRSFVLTRLNHLFQEIIFQEGNAIDQYLLSLFAYLDQEVLANKFICSLFIWTNRPPIRIASWSPDKQTSSFSDTNMLSKIPQNSCHIKSYNPKILYHEFCPISSNSSSWRTYLTTLLEPRLQTLNIFP